MIKNKEIMNIVTKDTWQKLILSSKLKTKKIEILMVNNWN